MTSHVVTNNARRAGKMLAFKLRMAELTALHGFDPVIPLRRNGEGLLCVVLDADFTVTHHYKDGVVDTIKPKRLR